MITNFKHAYFEKTADVELKNKILFVLHAGPGGTLKTVMDLIFTISNYFDCYLLVSNTKKMILKHYEEDELHIVDEWELYSTWLTEKCYNEEYSNIYFNILIKYNFDIVHIHHLIFHTFDLPDLCKKFKIPMILSLHDFYFICPSYTLLDGDYKYCCGDCNRSNTNKNCYIPRSTKTKVENLKSFVDEWRKLVLDMFSKIDIFISPSQYVKNVFNRYYSFKDNFRVIEHGFNPFDSDQSYFTIPSSDKSTKILFLGNLSLHKGSAFIKKLYHADAKDKLEFHFLGNTDKSLSDIGIHHGKYDSNNLHQFIQEIRPSFVGIFSIWPETYCYTLSEAWSFGIPVFVSNIGVLEDRVLNNGGGWCIDIYDEYATYDLIMSVIDNEEDYINKQKETKFISFNSMESMNKDYIEAYGSLLK